LKEGIKIKIESEYLEFLITFFTYYSNGESDYEEQGTYLKFVKLQGDDADFYQFLSEISKALLKQRKVILN